jgi:hypothetical protein
MRAVSIHPIELMLLVKEDSATLNNLPATSLASDHLVILSQSIAKTLHNSA